MTANTAAATTPRSTPDTDALQRRFSGHVTKLGVKTERATSLDAVAALAADLAAAVPADVRRVVLAPGLERMYPALRQRLEGCGVTLTPVDAGNPAATFGPAAVGISGASLGIAETGSYLITDALEDRLVRMLAHRHIVVLDVARLVADLDEAGAWLRDRFLGTDGSPPGRYASFITGPSRTADIEMSLTVGAHGPAELRVVFLDLEARGEETPDSGSGERNHAGE